MIETICISLDTEINLISAQYFQDNESIWLNQLVALVFLVHVTNSILCEIKCFENKQKISQLLTDIFEKYF